MRGFGSCPLAGFKYHPAPFDQAEGDHQALADIERCTARRTDCGFRLRCDGQRADACCLQHLAQHGREIGLTERGQNMGKIARVRRRHLDAARPALAVEEARADILPQRPLPRFRDETAPLLLRQPYRDWRRFWSSFERHFKSRSRESNRCWNCRKTAQNERLRRFWLRPDVPRYVNETALRASPRNQIT